MRQDGKDSDPLSEAKRVRQTRYSRRSPLARVFTLVAELVNSLKRDPTSRVRNYPAPAGESTYLVSLTLVPQ